MHLRNPQGSNADGNANIKIPTPELKEIDILFDSVINKDNRPCLNHIKGLLQWTKGCPHAICRWRHIDFEQLPPSTRALRGAQHKPQPQA